MQNSPCLKTLIKHTSLVSLGFVAIIIIINCMLDKKLLVFRLFFGFMFGFFFFLAVQLVVSISVSPLGVERGPGSESPRS